jgi:hypothetical protein
MQNGNWADRSCTEKHGYVCMKISGSESSGDEVPMDLGCKPVSGEGFLICCIYIVKGAISENVWFEMSSKTHSVMKAGVTLRL